MSAKGILLDLDNTLYDYLPCATAGIRAAHRVYKSYKDVGFITFKAAYDMAREQIHQSLCGQAAMHDRLLYFQRMCENDPRTIPLESAVAMYQAYWAAYFRMMALFPGARSFLQWCRRIGLPVVLLTDLMAEVQLRKVSYLRLGPYLQAVVTSEEAGVEKPAAAIFHLGLRKLGVNASNALMIGDHPERDIGGARRLGIHTIQVACGSGVEIGCGLTRPACIAKSFAAVRGHVAAYVKG